MIKVHILSNGNDWEALYVDGERIMGDHSLSVDDVMEVLVKFGVEVDYTSDYIDDDDFPPTLP